MNKGKEAFKLEGIVIPISVGSFTPAPISPIKKRIDEKNNFKKEEKRKKTDKSRERNEVGKES